MLPMMIERAVRGRESSPRRLFRSVLYPLPRGDIHNFSGFHGVAFLAFTAHASGHGQTIFDALAKAVV